ncbi:MAG: DUF4831 family protein [Bacteroidales bacterium]
MKSSLKILLALLVLLITSNLSSQILNPGDRVPVGAIVYSLPITNIHLVVEATHDSFVAGPYAKYAQKYLGVEALQESRESYKLSSVELIPYIEADPSVNIALYLGNQRNASANFLEMINQGLIMWSDSYAGKSQKMQYPNLNSNELYVKAMSGSNLTSEKSTLYRTVQSRTGSERVAVQQSQVVEKSVEKRAQEIASQIFHLRAKRLSIITGDTDATFSGDALRAAVEEINRLEDEYLSLFMGKSTTSVQKMSFDVVPKSNNEKQIYIAFRLSETSGLMPANNLSGRPVVLELIKEEQLGVVNMDVSITGKDKVIYRKPIVVNARVMDGQELLVQSRIPVYQMGELLSFPLGVATGRL